MSTIAFVTYAKEPDFNESDALVVPLLYKHDIKVVPVPWDDKKVDWKQFDLVVLRSAWDYHTRHREFMAWLDRLEADKVNIWNRIPTLRWNTNKSYLTMLGKKGVSVIPSIILTKPDEVSFTEISRWGTIVVKPTIGASAYGTERFDTGKGPSWQRHIEKMLADGPVIVQHYFEEIEQGEYSFIFFDKKYSHAVIKVPKKSEFRTQPWFGGSETHTDPDPAFVRQAEKVLAAIDEPLLYARVDGINVNGIFLLMELELAEPYLFLDTDSTSPQRFADAIVSHLG